MDDDMAGRNGDSSDIHDAATRIGILSQRTTNLETIVGDVRRELNQSILAVNQSIGAMSSKVDERFNSIASTIAERSRPQWQAMSVMLGAVVVLGSLVYWPIREQTGDLKETLQVVAAKMVTREELDWRSARGTEDRARTETTLADLRKVALPRVEWEEKNASRDRDIQNVREFLMTATENLQRQIDELKKTSNDTYNVRDVIMDLKAQIERLQIAVGERSYRSRMPSG